MKKFLFKIGAVLLISGIISLPILNCQGRENGSNKQEYLHHIGYLDHDNKDFSENFERCTDTLPIGFFHSAAPYVYSGTKRSFKNYIYQNYKNQGFSDNGFLNLRFLINCHGSIGNVEINELNNDFQNSDLNDNMVDQLIDLSTKEENWRLPKFNKPYDIYMYLIYKIENGNVTEILP